MTGTAVLKKSIRDTERLLRRPTLPADVRQEKERKLAALRHAATRQAVEQRRRALVAKYKMVRFVESKKAVRRLSKAFRAGDDAAITEARKDCLYMQFYPEDQKYLSLYPSTPMTDEEQLARRAGLREKIFAEHGSAEICLPGMHMAANNQSKGGKAASDDDDDEEEDFDDDDDEEDESDEEGDADNQKKSESDNDSDGESEEDEDDESEDSSDESDFEDDDDDYDSEYDDTDDAYGSEGSDGDSEDEFDDDSEDGDSPKTKKSRR